MVEQSVILLAGTEQFLKEEKLARIKSAFLDKESKDLNFNVFYGGSAAAKEILEAASTWAFLGRKRVILVRQVEDFSVSDKKLILSYIRTPHRQTLLVLETSQTNLNQSFFNEICKHARVTFCKPLKGNQLFGWIKGQVKARDKKIEERALALLVENLGNNLELLSKTLDNLILYIGKREIIRSGDAASLAGRDVEAGVFELFDAIVAGKKEKCFQVLDGLLKEGVNSSQILGALAYKMVSGRNKLKTSRFEQGFQKLQNTDADIKTGRQSQRIALELLLVRLLHF